MPLPSAMQEKKDQLGKTGEEAPPVAPPVTPLKEVPPSKEGARVTISREEFNELQAAKDKLATAEGRAAAMKDDLEAFQQRLTELESAAKGGSQGVPPASSAPPPSSIQVELPHVEITEKEKADFEEDSITLMSKIANNVFSDRAKALVAKIEEVLGKVGEVEKLSKNAADTTRNISRQSYTEKVAAKVGEFSNFEDIVAHKHWKDFTDGVETLTGQTYATLIANNVQNQNVTGMVAIFRKFYDKYMKDEQGRPEGYQGAIPTGESGAELPAGGKEKLKLSDRQALSKKYLNKQITYDEFQEQKKLFDLADAEGRLDYDS